VKLPLTEWSCAVACGFYRSLDLFASVGAKDESIIRKHAEISGFPAAKITEVKKMIDPTTAAG
jgi:hypothetical protein